MSEVDSWVKSPKAVLKSESKSKSKSAKTKSGNRERYEVIYRGLLRRFRKYYNIEFDSKTRFKSLKRYRKAWFFIECVSNYVKDVFKEHYSLKLIFSLCYLIYPNILEVNLEELKKSYPTLSRFLKVQKESKLQVNDILYDFTFTKMKLLLSNKEYSFLFKNFVTNINSSLKADEETIANEMLYLWK